MILLGGTIGIITLRFMAGLFIRWLEEFERLEDAGFITVAFVWYPALDSGDES